MKNFKFCNFGLKHRYFSTLKARPALALCVALIFTVLSFPYLIGGFDGLKSEKIKKANALEFESSTGYISNGKFVNAAILLTFSGQEPNFPNNFGYTINQMYNDSPVSVKNFFKAQSRSFLSVETLIAGNKAAGDANGAKIYAADKSGKTYMPRYGKWINSSSSYEEINEDGYDNRYYNEQGVPVSPSTEGAKISGERILLEQRLIREAIALAKDDLSKQLSETGGKAHSLAIITDASGEKSQWGDILWSHKSVLLNAQTLFGDGTKNYSDYYFSDENKRDFANLSDVYLGNGQISAYNVIASGELTARKIGNYVSGLSEDISNLYDVGLLAHELMHNFGFGDYYSYINKKHETVGEFDVLASPNPLPQYSLSYVREKAGWLDCDNFLYINKKSGSYTLYPVGSEKSDGIVAGKIILSDYSTNGEYFMVEVRSNEKNAAQTSAQAPAQTAPRNAARSESANPNANSSKTQGNPAYGGEPLPMQNAKLFDSCLSGSGLIIYRVSEPNAFLNEKGEFGSRDFCNMYGDEVYVFRKGGGESLNSPLGTFSFAMLGVDADKLNGSNAGKAGLSSDLLSDENDYSRFGIKKSQETQAKNALCYSNGENSGIVFENIVKNPDGSVSFNVFLPESDGNYPSFLDKKSVNVIDYFNGTKRLTWNLSAKSGYAYVLAIRATNRLERKAESEKLMLSADEIKNGYYSGYKTLFFKKVPLAEKKVSLPEFYDDALIFIAAETDGGTFCSRYAGELKRDDLTISQYFIKFCDPFYVATFGVCLAVVVIIVIVAVIKNRPQKTFDRKRNK